MPAHLVLRFILLPPEIYLFIIICCMAISMFQKVMKKFFGGLPVGNQHAEYQKIYHSIYHFQLAEGGFLPFGSFFKAKRNPLIHGSKPYVSTVLSGRSGGI